MSRFPKKANFWRWTLFCACIAAFFSPPVAHAQDYGGTFVLGYKDLPPGINPLAIESTVGSAMTQVLFDGLIELTPSGKILPGLAESWEVSQDRRIWTFHIRKDVFFHDGERLTANDAKFTYDFLKSGSSKTSWRFILRNVESIQAPDDFTIEIRLKEPKKFFLLVIYYIGVLPARYFTDVSPEKNEAFNRNPVGTGIFKFDSWDGNNTITLKANENYFRGRPYLDGIRFQHIPDQLEMWRKLQLGQIDLSYNDILPSDFAFLESSPELKTLRANNFMNFAIEFNHRKKIFKDRRMRRALSLAIDRQMIIDRALLGEGIETSGTFFPDVRNREENEYDPETSKRLFAELGYSDTDGDGFLDKNGKRLSFEVLIDKGDEIKRDAFLIIQMQLQESGVEATANEISVQEIISRGMAGNFGLMFVNYMALHDLPAISWHSENAGSFANLSGYRNKEVDFLLDKLMSSAVEERPELVQQINEAVRNDVAAIFLFSKYWLLAVNERIEGVDVSADRYPVEFASKVYIPRSRQ